jgi:hypothetical protein
MTATKNAEKARAVLRIAILVATWSLALSGCRDSGLPAKQASARPAIATDLVAPPRDPVVVEQRAKAVRQQADAIRAECPSGGDWDKWQQDTAPYRVILRDKAKKRGVLASDEVASGDGIAGGFPLFEIKPAVELVHVYDPESLRSMRADKVVQAGDDWLRQRGIDLIFVPVPQMTEVYIEHFLNPSPPDGIVAPHLRRTLLELLDDGVEVVDAFQPLRAGRRPAPDYLFCPADKHWSGRGQRIVADAVGKRLARYDFCQRSLVGPPIVKAVGFGDVQFRLGGYAALTDEERRRAIVAFNLLPMTRLVLADGSEPLDDPESPIMLIGDSFAAGFREELMRATNLRLRTKRGDGNTTQWFTDFLRETDLLDGVRVVVWVQSEQHMANLRPLSRR